MELNDVQKQAVRKWAAEGCSLSDIQKRLLQEFQISMTYMDVRFLVIDLGLALKDAAKRSASPQAALGGAGASAPAPGPGAAEDVGGDEDEGAALPPGAPAGSTLKIQVDRVMKAGAMVSGSVTFSDGTTAAWFVDQYGRLGLSATKPGYKPSQADIVAFQRELEAVLQKQGF